MLQINNREREELLQFACKNGQISLIRNLLKDNVDINALNAKGLSPLHLAVIEGNIEVTKLLISEGANIEIRLESLVLKKFVVAMLPGTRSGVRIQVVS